MNASFQVVPESGIRAADASKIFSRRLNVFEYGQEMRSVTFSEC